MVHVHLTATAWDYSVSAQLIAEDPAARQVIERDLHTLRQSLAEMGVSLEQFGAVRDDGSSRGAWEWQNWLTIRDKRVQRSKIGQTAAVTVIALFHDGRHRCRRLTSE